ncbi:MAG: response regulator transcription factor, partial [Caldilineaceae bacterium]|nr:response regulator transcription factor [Caldilineaceae bacterium]
MRVLLVDDHRLFLEGLHNLLNAQGIDVAGLANDGLDALAAARRLRPDVILMDIQMPRCDGVTAT